MELRRVCDTIIRSPSSPLLYFLAPSLSRRPYASILSPQSARSSIRPFNNAAQPNQSPAGAAAAAAAEEEAPNDSSQSKDTNSSTDALLDSLASGSQRSTASNQRTSRFSSPRAQESNRPGTSTSSSQSSQQPRIENEVRSDPDLMGLLNELPKPVPRPFDSQRSRYSPPPRQDSSSTDILSYFKNSRNRSSRPSSMDVSQMLSPTSSSPSSDLLGINEPPIPPPAARLRLSPSTGRSVQIDSSRGMDIGRGLKMLDINCARNRVRQDFNVQRFHERAGLKRKRLHSMRWRKRFKLGFRAAVQKVADMRRRGW